jgi:hypothetical protein
VNHNAALAAFAVRIATNPALTHPLAGQIIDIDTNHNFVSDSERADIHIERDDRRSLGSLIAWAYQLDDVTIRLRAFSDGTVHIYVNGTLSGDTVRVYTGFYDELAAELVERVDLVDNQATVSIHHLRAIQAGTYRTAVAA